ncbi:MAG: hypothetical protein M3433_01105 [Actinomycetota bacterium]|nr:hypothetical protein [Actinomycetota bacterium]
MAINDNAAADDNGAALRLAPSCEQPCWHRPDGQRLSLQEVLSGLDPAGAEQARRQHAEAIGALVEAALEDQLGGRSERARERALAASRLCQEIVGFWPSGEAAKEIGPALTVVASR